MKARDRAARLTAAAAATAMAAFFASPVVPAGAAEPAASSAPPLASQQAVAQALAHDAGLAQARESARAAREAGASMAVVQPPTLKFSTSATLHDPGTGAARRDQFALAWAPPARGEAALNRTAAQQRGVEAALAYELEVQRVVAETMQLHAGLAAVDDMLRWAETAQRQHAALNDVAQRQRRAGRRTAAEAIAVELQAGAADEALARLQLERDRLRQRLASRIGQPVDRVVADDEGGLIGAQFVARHDVPAGSVDTVRSAAGGAAPTTAPTAGQATADRLAVRVAQARCDAVDTEVGLAAIDDARWLKDVQLGYAPPQGTRAATWSVQFEVILPGVGPKHGSGTGLQARRAACRAGLERAERESAADLAQARAALDHARGQALHHRQRVLPLHRQALAYLREAQREGRADAAEVLAAEIRATEAHIEDRRRMLEWRQRDIDVARLSGHLRGG